ncbi:MAG: iron-sulfur cluster assembly scaffold protein [Chloroflexota bacterium]
MDSELDKLEEAIVADMKSTYTETVIDHAMNPRNVGSIPDADAYTSLLGPCGDNMEIWLKIRNGKVVNVSFWTDGCGTTIAAGSMATELAKGKTVQEALAISAEVIARNLGGLPEDSVHCAGLASSTLKKAMIEYLNTQREPWKRAYRKC